MRRTEFVHSIDGFAFLNSWDMQPGDWDQLRGTIQGAATTLSFLPVVQALIPLIPGAILLPPPFSNLVLARIVTDQIVSRVNPGTIGLCGGMAYAAADYFGPRWLPPRGEFATGVSIRNPGWAAGAESTLRSYLWRRLLDSLEGGGVAAQTLLWMGVVHNIFPFSTLGGAGWLRDRSREQFATIKLSIDSGRVCPIALIGTSPNPMDQHQVLVTGYDDPGPLGPHSCRLFVYEPDSPNVEQTIDFDFSGAHQPSESVGSPVRGPLQGFFASGYGSVTPPMVLDVSEGLSAPTIVSVGELAGFGVVAQNVGFGDTPPLQLYVAGRAGSTIVDAGGEAAATRLLSGGGRALMQLAIIGPPSGPRTYFPAFSVVSTAGQQAWRGGSASGQGRLSADVVVSTPAAGWGSLGGTLNSPPSVVASPNGRLNVFGIGTDNSLWIVFQTSPNNGWSSWSRCNGLAPAALSGRPFAMVDRDGRLHVFCRGVDGQIWHTHQDAVNGPFGGWEGLGGNTPNDPSASFNSDGRLEVFSRQNDNSAGHRWIGPTGWWPPFGGWDSRGGRLAGAPALARSADGRLEIFARFDDHSLQHQWQTAPGGGWSDWETPPFGGSLTSDVSVGVNADGRLEVFCVSSGRVWQRWQTAPSNGWSSWHNTGQPAAPDARVAVVTNSFGGMEVASRAPDNSIWTAGFRPGGAWTPWRPLGGTPDGDPALGLNADGRVEAFVRGTDHTLQLRGQVAPGNWG